MFSICRLYPDFLNVQRLNRGKANGGINQSKLKHTNILAYIILSSSLRTITLLPLGHSNSCSNSCECRGLVVEAIAIGVMLFLF